MLSTELVIEQTKKWIREVVVGCNFCPFAAKELRQDTIRYYVDFGVVTAAALQSFLEVCAKMDEDRNIETSFVILPDSFQDFDDYLDLVSLAEKLLQKNKYEGIYQVASFHPMYRFSESAEDDPANFTNRSPYPMLHILREETIEAALEKYPDPEKIPERNVAFARTKGIEYMKTLLESVKD